MNSKKGAPSAWDDDWVNVADRPASKQPQPDSTPKPTKAERRAQHLEQQKQLWDSAENPGRFHWLEAQGVTPHRQEFKPQVTLLSRKPQITIAKKDAPGGIEKLSINDDQDSEEEARKKREEEFEERTRKAKIEREEKQRRYAEARERIMGSTTPSSPVSLSRDNSNGRDGRRSGGSGMGAGRGRGNNTANIRRSQPESPAEQSPARTFSGDGKLFDPDDMSRRLAPRRESSFATSSEREVHPLRQPRGPESSGRGGFGFAPRGGRQTA